MTLMQRGKLFVDTFLENDGPFVLQVKNVKELNAASDLRRLGVTIP